MKSLALVAVLTLLACAPATSTGTTEAPPVEAARTETGDTFSIPASLQTSSTGLQYSIDRPGTGAQAFIGQTVSVHYTGWLKDGTQFDTSRDGAPLQFPLGMGRVIRGWDEGIAGMKVGEKRTLVIPSSLGYGARGMGGVIPPDATLVFQIELIGVE